MITKRLGTAFIILGFLSILLAPINILFHLIPKELDILYLSSTGVVFISSGVILRKKNEINN